MKHYLIRLRRFLFGTLSFFFRHLGLIFLSLLLLIAVWGIFQAKDLLARSNIQPSRLLTFFRNPQSVLSSTNDRTNFLILGTRGEGEDSPDLTDVMLIVSYSHKNHDLALISVPRDLWVDSLKTKINSVYHYGKEKGDQNGIKMTQTAILETAGLPIHYSAVIDFALFQDVVDLIGGVDVNVQHTFTDKLFPIPGKENALPISSRYETITFNAGLQHMDGVTALKFVRSRHAEGDEGTDLARSARQHLIVSAIRQKIVNPKFFLNKEKVTALYEVLMKHTDTNITPDLYPSLARLAFDSRNKSSKEINLSYTPDSQGVAILENPPVSKYNGQWVLIARDGNWLALQQYIRNKLEGTN